MAIRSSLDREQDVTSSVNPSAAGLAYRRYRDALHRYVVRHFGLGPPDPEDVVQVAFEKFHQLDEPEAIDNPYTFLIRCSRNYVIDQRRRAAVRTSYANQTAATSDGIDHFDAERVLSSKERWEAVARAIAALDDRRREMLLMNRVSGLSCAEIARRKGCSVSLVKLLVAEALVACRDALRPGEDA